ncbi:nucleotidyltransferase domain-containing protein [Vulcanisaeta sp. JCM 14467]
MLGRIYEVARRNNIRDPDKLLRAINKALDGLNPVAVFIVGSLARGEFVLGLSDIDLVVVVSGEPPFRAKVIGSELGDVEVIAFTVSELCSHYMDNNLMIEALSTGVPIIGDPRELMKQCH